MEPITDIDSIVIINAKRELQSLLNNYLSVYPKGTSNSAPVAVSSDCFSLIINLAVASLDHMSREKVLEILKKEIPILRST